MIERCLETELDTHLGYPKHRRKGKATGNMRNGSSQKTLKGEQGHVDIEVPRDRQGTFEPQLVKKGQTRLEGFDDKILALYARGMTTRDIQAQLQELYGVDVSPTLISNVTEAVMDEVRQWQQIWLPMFQGLEQLREEIPATAKVLAPEVMADALHRPAAMEWALELLRHLAQQYAPEVQAFLERHPDLSQVIEASSATSNAQG